jgi:DNA-binding NtrC family response regulator
VLENARLTDELETRRRELEHARTELERLNSAQAAELAETKEALAHAHQDLKHEYPDIIGRSPAMRRVLESARELENVIANALLMADGDTVGPADLTLTQTHAPRARRGRRLQDVERDAVEAALRETGGNRTRAAELLGISRVTLQRRLKKWRQTP